MKLIGTAVALPALAVVVTVWAGFAAAEDMNGMVMPKGASGSSGDPVYAKALEGSMSRMMSGMAVKPSGSPDADFVGMMIPHHQGAIDMARIELEYGKDPMLRKMAAGIVAAQEKEIAEMQAWKARHGK